MIKCLLIDFFQKNKFWNFSKKFYILIVLAIIYIPLIVIIFLSFTNPSVKQNVVLNFEKNWNVGENYTKLFFDSEYNGNFLSSLLNSFIIGIIVTPISLIIGVITTFGIYRSTKITQSYVLNTSKVTIVNPDVITGIALSTLFVIAFLPLGLSLGWFTIILSHISFTTPYVIVTIYPRMMKMNSNLILASYDLNHGKVGTLFRIIIPYLLPVILVAAIISFATSFDDFIITNLVRGRVNTISTEFFTMRKGIKSWAITFGALIIFVTLFFVILISFWKIWREKKFLSPFWKKIKLSLSRTYLKPQEKKLTFKGDHPTEMTSRAE